MLCGLGKLRDVLVLMKVERCFGVLGELDPDRIGSGIQYGDATLRRNTRQQAEPKRLFKCDC